MKHGALTCLERAHQPHDFCNIKIYCKFYFNFSFEGIQILTKEKKGTIQEKSNRLGVIVKTITKQLQLHVGNINVIF